jgi:ABC-2 type transport system permease protein
VRALWVIALKDLRLIARDRGALLFTLIVPVVVVTIVAGSLHGTDASLSIRLPVVDEDEGPVATVLIEALSAHLEVEVVDLERAETLVSVEKKAAAALVLPERMSKRYLAGRPSTLTLLTDPAKGSELATIKALFLVAERDAEEIADPFFERLLTLEEQSLTGSRLTTTSFEQNIPGFSLMFVLIATLFGTAFTLDDERSWNTMTRLRVAPIGQWSYLGGKLLARYLLAVLQTWILFGFGRIVFGLPLGPSLATFVLMTLAIVWSIIGFSLVVSGFMSTREQIIPVGLTVVMIACSIGGCWWPLYLEPPWLQQGAHLFLTAWAMDGLLDLILRERALAEVWPTLLVLMGYGAACLVAGAWLQRPAER